MKQIIHGMKANDAIRDRQLRVIDNEIERLDVELPEYKHKKEKPWSVASLWALAQELKP